MKKTYLFLLFCLLILRGSTNAQNIYESIGKKAEVLTLSNGQYQEIFPNDTLVRIGSVLFNTVTQEVVEFVEKSDADSYVAADVASRFLSVDPIGRKYPELTPYQFASNTPIQAIDLDGLEANVVIAGNGDGRWDRKDPKLWHPTQYETHKDYPFFLKHAELLSKRLGDKGRSYTADSGDQLITSLKLQTKQQGTINSFVYFGHGTADGLSMDWDEGFYKDKDDPTKYNYQGLERRASVDILKKEVAAGSIKFETDAICILGSCNAGADDYQNGNSKEKTIGGSLASRLSFELGITVIGADNETNIVDKGNKLTTDGTFYKFTPIKDTNGKTTGVSKTALGKTIDPKDYIPKK